MNVKHISLYLALISGLAMQQAVGQTIDNKFVAGLSAIFLDYQGPISGDYLQYESFSPGISISGHGYLNPFLNLSVNSSFVPDVNYPMDDGELLSTSLTDVNVLIQLKSNNGKVFRQNAFWAPYLASGIGLNTASNNLRWYVPATVGMRFRISKNVSFNLEGTYKLGIDGKKQHVAYGAGFVFGLPGGKESEVPDSGQDQEGGSTFIAQNETPDRDGDGISDEDDRCPDEPGPVTFFGCPAPSENEGPENTRPRPLGETPKRPTDPYIVDQGSEGGTDQGGADLSNPDNPYKPLATDLSQEPSEADKAFLEDAMDHVHFKVASDELTQDSYQVLDKVAAILKKYPTHKLKVSGYTDNTGEDKVNKVLSVTRAFNVKRYLVYQKDIKLSRIISDGYSSQNPIADNATSEGRSRNRRVEFQLVP